MTILGAPGVAAAMAAALAALSGFAGYELVKSLILHRVTPKGLHYTGLFTVICAAVILGGGCSGSVSFKHSSKSLSSGSGCV